MTSIVHKPLAMFRRDPSPKPLHARWGDVAISAPTQGSWNQYDNPIRRPSGRQRYGPGYIPDFRPSRGLKTSSHDSSNQSDSKEKFKSTLPAGPAPVAAVSGQPRTAPATSMSRKGSLRLGALHPHRLSVRLASRPKQLQGESSHEREIFSREVSPQEGVESTYSPSDNKQSSSFAYRPIRPEYSVDATAKKADNPRYRYIPAKNGYADVAPSQRSPRSLSTSPFRGSSKSQRDLSTGPLETAPRIRDPLRMNPPSPQRMTPGLSPNRRKALPFDYPKRASVLKPMTSEDMVPDSDDLY
ncbi:hypothetical protein N7462_008451 [Penicillium macrosclerotiorum]|uniref:uncharacterized protein n=1 Tax=Penicillium macrosclerotiorum TaxID=303699 RepID=UPI002548966B|nr:uncharacterized protein N7462_008451 [Penicillium macrosclerotiorum]KAJ5675554.1 hypothetical protein N7462_008451 [Penicillium macrosclerotiorum]